MKKTLYTVFVCICVLLCLTPFAALLFYKQPTNAGNEIKTKKPAVLTQDGKFNSEYLPELGKYFEENFAFRTQAITADNRLMCTLFGVSDTPTVIAGRNGWLYYSSTLDDYMGTNRLSEAQVNGIVQNLEILRDYAESCGSEFLLTVAPNKNTLYPESMPYYYIADNNAVGNKELLHKALEKSDINYCNLFDVLSAQNETLYLKTDSHWNNKGALLAYNTILDKLEKSHEDFSSAEVSRKKDFHGDLSNMLYPASNETEYNYYYNPEEMFTYTTETKSTEDPLIKTRSDSTGTLYMYRDSFGNALVPFFATAFENATFTKSFPMILENDLTPGSADTVIFEIAQRNINWFLKMPPVVSAPEIMVYEVLDGTARDTQLQLKECEYSPSYIEISGKLEYDIKEGSPVYIQIKSETGESRTFRCFNTLGDEGENGFLAYIKSEDFEQGEALSISVLTEKDDEFYKLDTKSLTYGGNYER